MMKIMVCNPDTNLSISNQAGLFRNTTGICAPLGIGYVTAVLRVAGFRATMHDFFDAPESVMAGAIRAVDPDVIGISCLTEHRGAALKLARLAKTIKSSIHVMLGGSHASFFPATMLERYSEVDSIVLFEAEATVVKWMQVLDENSAPDNAPPGVAFRCEGKVKVMDRAPFIEDLDTLPFPVRDLGNQPPYKAFPQKYSFGRQAAVMASRGCPYRCQFCSTTRYWGQRYRMRSVENVIAELDYLVNERKMEYVQFFDDALTANKPWILSLCREICRRNLRFDWDAITRVNFVDEEICRAMKSAGCCGVTFGVESFSDRILKEIHKGVTGEQAVGAIKTARRNGLATTCLLMIGNPGESGETIRETIDGLKRARPDNIGGGLVTVFPRTDLYEIAGKAGMMDDSYWLDESLAAPVYTVEQSLETLVKFLDDIFDAHWAGRWYVGLYRGLGLRKIRNSFPGRREGLRARQG